MTMMSKPIERESSPDILHAMGLPADPARPTAERLPVAARRVPALASLFVEGAPATAVYVVRHGTFKTVKTDCDGYEQVLDFVGRGGLLGGEALGRKSHPCGSVALEDSSAWVLPLSDLQALCRSVPTFDVAVQRALSQQLLHASEMAELMSAVSAEVRLARFLLHQSARMAAQGQSPRRLLLRMSRRDIASYLGLAHETISRALTLFARRGYVRVSNREIDILDAEMLSACARSTRGRWGATSEQALAA